MTFEEILEIAPYSLDRKAKEKLLTERLVALTKHHKEKCAEYKAILKALNIDIDSIKNYKELPYLPVRLFKELSLKSVDDSDVVKTMTSSGTSGQRVSKIFLDRTTSSNQQKTMVKIVNSFTGSSRMPMIIIDCPSVVKNRAMFSARGAGILGFSMFGAKKVYALDDEMKLDVDGLREFLDKYKGQTIFLFGFTFMIWQHFYKELVRLKGEGIEVDLSDGVMIHGGGWKKLINEAVSPEEFHQCLKDVCGLDHIHDYYGMVEQTGCIYMQCECGHLHASNFSDVIIRNPIDFSECKNGERGIIQVVSTIPESYPGHSLLTEDEGMILGEDDCPCGRKGKYFKIFGRLKNAEIRGCSDTYAADHSKRMDNQAGVIDKENSDSIIKVANKLKYLVGDFDVFRKIVNQPVMVPFSDSVVSFLDDLSKELMRNRDAKGFPDIVTLGFWLRRSSLKKLEDRFLSNSLRVGRGVTFHIAPSNVAVNYAYSLFASLLCGNSNIVRVPSKDFPQVAIINELINTVLEKHEELRPYICLVRYDRNEEINEALSAMADTRIIWGGDKTIQEFRKYRLSPRATEITFADRYSLAIIDSDAYMTNYDPDKVASDFYNDTYLSDQNACTSPRVVVWTGSKIKEAQKLFWEKLHILVKKKYFYQSIMGVDKLSQGLVVSTKSDQFGEIKLNYKDNLLYRVSVEQLPDSLMNYRGNCGYFYEYECDDIMELFDFCNNTHCQTIGIVGNKEITNPLLSSGCKGVDRVVAIGHTMDFDLIWDGYNLVERLTRTIGIGE